MSKFEVIRNDYGFFAEVMGDVGELRIAADRYCCPGASKYIQNIDGELYAPWGVLEGISRTRSKDVNKTLLGELEATNAIHLVNAMISISCNKKLFDHQKAAVRAFLRTRYGHGIIQVPTGGGKTLIGWCVGMAMGGVWVWVAPNREQMARIKKQFDGLLTELKEKTYITENPLKKKAIEMIEGIKWIYCTPLTLDSVKQYMDDIGITHVNGVIYDECHLLPAETRKDAFQDFPANMRLGLSATPFCRQDPEENVYLNCIFGPTCYTIGVQDLQLAKKLPMGKIDIICID